MVPYYDQSSALRRLMFEGCTYHISRARSSIVTHTRHNFFGPEGEARQGYVAKYHFPKDYVPEVLVVNAAQGVAFTTVYERDSLGSLLAEDIHPVFYRDPAGALLLRNLNMVGYSVTASGGYIDLTSYFVQHPRVEDSPIILANSYDDRIVIDPSDPRLTGSRLITVLDGTYTAYWQSTVIDAALLNNTTYITIGGEQTQVATHVFENVWDTGLETPGLWRLDGETNTEFKTRFQHYALSARPQTAISSVLGEARAVVWNPQDTWSLTGSGCLTAEPLNLPQYAYVSEILQQFGSVFLFSQTPSGVVQVFYNQSPLTTDEYTITGNVLMPSSTRVQSATQGQLTAKYRVINYTVQASGNYITSLGPGNHRPELVYTMIARKVQIVSAPRRVKNWRWGKQNLGVTGSAVFG